MRRIRAILFFVYLLAVGALYGQDTLPKAARAVHADTTLRIKGDTAMPVKKATADTLALHKHDPRKATIRSAIVPGWGQAYNRQYWKIPLVYGVLAIPAVTFVYNNKWYKKTRDAYQIVIDSQTTRYNEIDPKLQGLINSPQSLQYYRNQFRRDRDYSILFFLAAWGVNVVDATVFGHLKDFDVSDNLSLHLQPGFNPATKKLDVGVALNFRNRQWKPMPAF